MERLTNSIDYCKMNCDFGSDGKCFFEDKSKCYEKSIYEKLREYEDAEEQGLLFMLTCGKTQERKCIVELYELLYDIAQKAIKKDVSLYDYLRVKHFVGAGIHLGEPPISIILSSIEEKYEEVIHTAFKAYEYKETETESDG